MASLLYMIFNKSRPILQKRDFDHYKLISIRIFNNSPLVGYSLLDESLSGIVLILFIEIYALASFFNFQIAFMTSQLNIELFTIEHENHRKDQLSMN